MLSNQKYRNIFFQICLVAALIAAFYWLIQNTHDNLSRIGLDVGFGFWNQPAGFDISLSLIHYDTSSSTYGRVFLVGVLNTLLVSFSGIIAATLLGFFIGFLGLSKNFLAAKLAGFYVEILRNTPLLVQCVFWYFGVITALPNIRNSLHIGEAVFLNQRGVYLPKPQASEEFIWVIAVFFMSIILAALLIWWNKRYQERTGRRLPVGWINTGIMVILPLACVWLLQVRVEWQLPTLQGFNFSGGILLPPEFLALFLALSLYTSAYIAEIVRSGFLSVDYGQTEAGKALGLRQNRINRLVIIPQAMRVIIPPLTNQYLNLIKNSSLAVAIGYPDLVSVFTGTTLNQTGRAIEIVLITMMFYLFISLLVSGFMNWYNSRLAIIER